MKPVALLYMKWLLLALVPVAAVYFMSQWAFTSTNKNGDWVVPGEEYVPVIVLGLLVLTVVFFNELAKPVSADRRTTLRFAVLGLIFGGLFLAPKFSRYLWTEISTVAGWSTREEPKFQIDHVCLLSPRLIREDFQISDEEKKQYADLFLGFHLEKESMGDAIVESVPCRITARIQHENKYGVDHPVLAIWQGTIQVTHDQMMLTKSFDTSEMADELARQLIEDDTTAFGRGLRDPVIRGRFDERLQILWQPYLSFDRAVNSLRRSAIEEPIDSKITQDSNGRWSRAATYPNDWARDAVISYVHYVGGGFDVEWWNRSTRRILVPFSARGHWLTTQAFYVLGLLLIAGSCMGGGLDRLQRACAVRFESISRKIGSTTVRIASIWSADVVATGDACCCARCLHPVTGARGDLCVECGESFSNGVVGPGSMKPRFRRCCGIALLILTIALVPLCSQWSRGSMYGLLEAVGLTYLETDISAHLDFNVPRDDSWRHADGPRHGERLLVRFLGRNRSGRVDQGEGMVLLLEGNEILARWSGPVQIRDKPHGFIFDVETAFDELHARIPSDRGRVFSDLLGERDADRDLLASIISHELDPSTTITPPEDDYRRFSAWSYWYRFAAGGGRSGYGSTRPGTVLSENGPRKRLVVQTDLWWDLPPVLMIGGIFVMFVASIHLMKHRPLVSHLPEEAYVPTSSVSGHEVPS